MQHSSKVILKWNQIILFGGDLLNHFYFEYAAFRFVSFCTLFCALFSFPSLTLHKQPTAYFVVLVVIFANVFSFHVINTFSVPSSSFSFLVPIKSDTISRPHLIIINAHVFFCLLFYASSTSIFLWALSLSLTRSLFICIHKIGKNDAEKRIIFCVWGCISVWGVSMCVCVAFKTFVVQKFQKKICKWFHFDTVAFASIHIQLNGIFVHTCTRTHTAQAHHSVISKTVIV